MVSSLCELVECWSSDIRSGWRPLFACLRRWPPRTAQLNPAQFALSDNNNSIKDVATSFVLHGSANSLIFTNAAMDAILCQLHYLKTYRNSPYHPFNFKLSHQNSQLCIIINNNQIHPFLFVYLLIVFDD